MDLGKERGGGKEGEIGGWVIFSMEIQGKRLIWEGEECCTRERYSVH